MYIPRNKSDLYIALARYIAYAPDFSRDRFVGTQEVAESELYPAIDKLFSDDRDLHMRMRAAADAAFLACREGRAADARDGFGIIVDELSSE